MNKPISSKSNLIKTPDRGIPIGEPLKTPDGYFFLRIKRPQREEYEDLSLDNLVSMIVSGASTQIDSKQVPHAEGAAEN